MILVIEIDPTNWFLWEVAAVMLLLAIVIVNYIWKRKHKRILKSLEDIIFADNDEKKRRVYQSPKDSEKALKTLLEARKAEVEKLRIMETYRRDYIGNVAHELKTPIFTIQGYLDSVADELSSEECDMETVKVFVDKAILNTGRLSRIISDLDTITKYESGFLQLDLEEFDLLDLVREVLESMELQAQLKKVNLHEYSQPGVKYLVYADKFRIRQVLTNLGINSIKYGKTDGYTKFRISHTGDKVIVEVADNGIGIPRAHLGRIFERFYRVEKSRSRDSGGSGLGLSICKHIIEAHGETISVLSTEGAGSVFSFGLKAVKHKSE